MVTIKKNLSRRRKVRKTLSFIEKAENYQPEKGHKLQFTAQKSDLALVIECEVHMDAILRAMIVPTNQLEETLLSCHVVAHQTLSSCIIHSLSVTAYPLQGCGGGAGASPS